nr:mannan synthase 1-like [Ipomoea batatas]
MKKLGMQSIEQEAENSTPMEIRGGGLKEVGEVVDGVTGLDFLKRHCGHWNLDLDNSREKKASRVCEQKIGIKTHNDWNMNLDNLREKKTGALLYVHSLSRCHVNRVYMAIVIVGVKCFGKKRYTRYKLNAMKEDLEQNQNYPKVLIQIPMFNEKEVYKLSIGAVCGFIWPSDRFIVQVLDDSTNDSLRKLVEDECKMWMRRGVNVKYETRNNRNGYKAGALREGLKKQYVDDCEFVAIFDADFQPDNDFLWRTIPYLLENSELALVQARWKFGTAGVWRIQALHDAGGWKDRTTVEDMDLAVRASLRGWKFLYIGDLEIPPCREVLDRHINGWVPRVQNCKELRLGFVLLPPCFGDLECHPLDFTMITDQEGFSLPRSKMSSEGETRVSTTVSEGLK